MEQVSGSVVGTEFHYADGSVFLDDSGVVYSADGLILTTGDGLDMPGGGVKSIDVVMPSGEKVPATLAAKDTKTGIILLGTHQNGLSPVRFSATSLAVGDILVAIAGAGETRNWNPVVVRGVNLSTDFGISDEPASLTGLLVVDSGGLPGSAGLFDTAGEFVGLLTGESESGLGNVTLPAPMLLSIAKRLAGK